MNNHCVLFAFNLLIQPKLEINAAEKTEINPTYKNGLKYANQI